MQLDYKRIDFDTKWILNGSKSIIYRESINSTLSIALDKERQINDKGKVVITDNQTSGKGTHGKQWISTPYNDFQDTSSVDPSTLTGATPTGIPLA